MRLRGQTDAQIGLARAGSRRHRIKGLIRVAAWLAEGSERFESPRGCDVQGNNVYFAYGYDGAIESVTYPGRFAFLPSAETGTSTAGISGNSPKALSISSTVAATHPRAGRSSLHSSLRRLSRWRLLSSRGYSCLGHDAS